jgi:hypothetical protein
MPQPVGSLDLGGDPNRSRPGVVPSGDDAPVDDTAGRIDTISGRGIPNHVVMPSCPISLIFAVKEATDDLLEPGRVVQR